jgi:hypothetical protein
MRKGAAREEAVWRANGGWSWWLMLLCADEVGDDDDEDDDDDLGRLSLFASERSEDAMDRPTKPSMSHTFCGH